MRPPAVPRPRLPALALAFAGALALAGACSDPGGSSSVGQLTPDSGVDAQFGTGDADTRSEADGAGMDALDGMADDTMVPDTGAPADTGPTSDTTPDTTPPADTSTSQDTGGGNPPESIGGGILLSEIDSSYLELATASARFTDPQPDPVPEIEFGACGASFLDPNAAPAAVPYGYDAGAISVTGLIPDITLTPLSEGPNGTGYASPLADDHENLLPGGGGLVTVDGAGGADIGSFSAVVQAPEQVFISSPVFSLFDGHSTSDPLTVTWNAGTGDQTVVGVSPLDGEYMPRAGYTVVCILEGDPGTFTVPAAALAQIVDGGGDTNVVVAVSRLRAKTVDVSGLDVTTTLVRSSGTPLLLE